MIDLKYKRIPILRAGLGVASTLNLIVLLLTSPEFLSSSGPFSGSLALSFRSNNLLTLLPESLISSLPYFFEQRPIIAPAMHVIFVIMFTFRILPRFSVLGYLCFEFLLLSRIGPMVHGGQLLTIWALFAFVIYEFVSDDKKWVASGFWVCQFILVYLFSGIYKDVHQWFIVGDAIQRFHSLEFQNLWKEPLNLEWFGPTISRLIYPIEFLAPLALLSNYFLSKSNRRLTILCVVALSLIHLGSWILFSIFTFPFLGLCFLLGIYLGFQSLSGIDWQRKALVLAFVTPFHLLPALKVEVPPFNLFPLLNKWTLFSKVPKVVPGGMRIEVISEDRTVYESWFNQSFHWTRYRFLVDDRYPNHQQSRREMIDYLCREHQASLVRWTTPGEKIDYSCSK